MPCPKLAEGDVVRVTRVDDCCAPVVGPGNAFVDDCWASVQMAANVEDGTDIDFRAMNGHSCGFKRGCPSFRGFDITAEFFSASPELIEIMTGNPVYRDYAGRPIGWDDCSIGCNGGFALEVWQNIVGEECLPGAAYQGFYWLLPCIANGILGDITINNEGVTFTLTGNTRATGGWCHGPYNVQAQNALGTPGPLLLNLGSGCHRRGFVTTVAPPTPFCGYVTVPPNNCIGS